MTALKYFIQQELEKLEGKQLKQVLEFSEIRIANFEPKQGSQEAGVRPTIIFHNNTISMYTTTVISILLTTNQRRASVPSSVCIPGGEDSMYRTTVISIPVTTNQRRASVPWSVCIPGGED